MWNLLIKIEMNALIQANAPFRLECLRVGYLDPHSQHINQHMNEMSSIENYIKGHSRKVLKVENKICTGTLLSKQLRYYCLRTQLVQIISENMA
jgi:hypothetical protein